MPDVVASEIIEGKIPELGKPVNFQPVRGNMVADLVTQTGNSPPGVN
jgi:hypothetical protein